MSKTENKFVSVGHYVSCVGWLREQAYSLQSLKKLCKFDELRDLMQIML